MSLVIKGNGRKLIIERNCDFSDSPRTWDNLGIVVAAKSYSNLSDEPSVVWENSYSSREDFIENGIKEVKKQILINREEEVCVYLPIHIYKHSGTALSTTMGYPFNCQFDSGTIGFIVATKQGIRENWGVERVTKKLKEQTLRILEAEVETLSHWVGGDVYAFRVEDEDENVLDSCGGFYGSDFKENGLFEHAEAEFPKELLEMDNLDLEHAH